MATVVGYIMIQKWKVTNGVCLVGAIFVSLQFANVFAFPISSLFFSGKKVKHIFPTLPFYEYDYTATTRTDFRINMSTNDDDIPMPIGKDDEPRYRSNLQKLIEFSRLKEENLSSERQTKSNKGRKYKQVENNEEISFPPNQKEEKIDAFLRGEYLVEETTAAISGNAPMPNSQLSPAETVTSALYAIRDLDFPQKSFGAAIFSKFLTPLSRSDRWGSKSNSITEWKQLLRRSLTPNMLASNIRNSDIYNILLNWQSIDVTQGVLEQGDNISFVSVCFYFEEIEPVIFQFTLRKIRNMWLIDSADTKKEWFIE